MLRGSSVVFILFVLLSNTPLYRATISLSVYLLMDFWSYCFQGLAVIKLSSMNIC